MHASHIFGRWRGSTAAGNRRWQRSGPPRAQIRAHTGRGFRAYSHFRGAGGRAFVWHGPISGGKSGLERLHVGTGAPQFAGQRAFCAFQPGLWLFVAQSRHWRSELWQKPHHLARGIHQAIGLLDHRWEHARADQPELRQGHRFCAHDARIRAGILAMQAALLEPGTTPGSGTGIQAPRFAHRCDCVRFLPLAAHGRLSLRSGILSRSRRYGARVEGNGHRTDGERLAAGGVHQRKLFGNAAAGTVGARRIWRTGWHALCGGQHVLRRHQSPRPRIRVGKVQAELLPIWRSPLLAG